MSGFYNQRSYMGQIAKKPRLGPRGPHLVPGNQHGDEDGKRLMSFKEFILSQHNDINEQEALARYSDYKTDFTRRQIDKFFKEHEEEEWFRNKYRPIEIKKFEEADRSSKAKRKELYNQLIEKEGSDNIIIDEQHRDTLSRFLDNFSLLLEGATLDEIEKGDAPKLYSVSTIYIPKLHPSVDKSMIEEFAKNHPGFLRISMSEAQFFVNEGFRRKVWITYKQMDYDSLRKLVWEFNAHKFQGQETQAQVHRDVGNRIRYAPFWFCHSTSTKSDLKNVAKLLTYFEGEDCPLLEDIKNYLIDETNEEEKALGLKGQDVTDFEFTQDPELLKALDKVVLYLRLVYSYDYYAFTEHKGEDDMPQKVGLMLARPTLQPSSTYGDCPEQILREFIEAQRARLDSFLSKPTLSEIELQQLGLKDPVAKVEEFIFNNTQEKKEGEKYLCKLTKKRFTAAEFVRKHMFNRCGKQLDEVRMNAEFFNNYLADPRRPM